MTTMREVDPLDMLDGLQPPEPSHSARKAALDGALAAYKQAEKGAAPTQGSGLTDRLISGARKLWSMKMTYRSMAGPAFATLLIAPVAGLVAYSILSDSIVPRPMAPEAAMSPKSDMSFPAANNPAAAPEKKTEAIAEDAAPLADMQEYDKLAGIPDTGTPSAAQAPLISVKRQAAESSMVAPVPAMQLTQASGDRIAEFSSNGIKRVADEPVSTFSIDTDTASYAMVRRQLEAGTLPVPETVRVEEMINYFPYEWPAPESAETPFNPTITVMPTPWDAGTKLMHVAIKGFELPQAQRPKSNLVFLVDTSGSMDEPNKLPLVKASLKLLLDRLEAGDTVGIVAYAGEAGVALEPTPVSDRAKITDAIDRLGAGGSTAGAAGIEEAYRLAGSAFVKDGVNRVLLATDGDFNVGPSDDEALKRLIEEKRRSGIFLSVLGFGEGNYNDGLMQVLAQNGNGTAAYIDTLAEAEKTLVQEATANLFPIAKDVKIQVEFNPQAISEYRLIGYESRMLSREDFNNDRVDAGEIGSGHSVTAIYEIVPVGSTAASVDPLRYAKPQSQAGEAAGAGAAASDVAAEELAFVRIRYKKPDGEKSALIEQPVMAEDALGNVDAAPQDVRFSVAVAAFGQKLRDADALAEFGYGNILDMAQGSKGTDPFGYRAGFLTLVRLADGLEGGR
jgi:Ca-activated chloride channel family protein